MITRWPAALRLSPWWSSVLGWFVAPLAPRRDPTPRDAAAAAARTESTPARLVSKSLGSTLIKPSVRFHSPPYPIAPSATFFHLGKSPISPHFCTLLYHYRSLSPSFSVSLQSSVFSFQSSVSSLQSPLPLTRSLLQSETVAIFFGRCCFALFSSELARGVWHKFSQFQLCSVHLVSLRLKSWWLFRCVRLRFYRWIVPSCYVRQALEMVPFGCSR